MFKFIASSLGACLFLLAAAFVAAAQGQTVCDVCDEDSYQDSTEVWHYFHRFDDEGDAMRLCSEGGTGHTNCHHNWVEGTGCTGLVHPQCNNLALAAEREISNLLAAVDENGVAGQQALRKRVAQLMSASFQKEEGILRVINCAGQVVAQWRVSPDLAQYLDQPGTP